MTVLAVFYNSKMISCLDVPAVFAFNDWPVWIALVGKVEIWKYLFFFTQGYVPGSNMMGEWEMLWVAMQP